MKKKNTTPGSGALIFITLVMAAVLAVTFFSIGETKAWADEYSNRLDTGGTLMNPLLYLLLRNEEEKDRENTVFSVGSLSGQTTGGVQGSLSRVAQYKPLDSGIKMSDLFYMQAFSKSIFSLRVDDDSSDSRRVEAVLSQPGSYQFSLLDTRVFHRITFSHALFTPQKFPAFRATGVFQGEMT